TNHSRGLHATHPVVAAIEDCAVVDDVESGQSNLRVVPVLLIERAIPLDAPIYPPRLPAELTVGQVVWREIDGCHIAPVLTRLHLPRLAVRSQRRITRWRDRRPIKTTGAKTLRPGVVQQRILGDLPAQVRAAFEAGIGLVEMLRIDI